MTQPEFWKNKNVLVTGHTGFKGAWLCFWLTKMGANVSGIALKNLETQVLYSALKQTEFTSYIQDIRNNEMVEKIIMDVNPEVVFHLAAQPLVRQSYQDPHHTYTTNVVGTLNILESCRKLTTLRSIINITTDKCYENNEWVWDYRETDKLGGIDPYSSSKACSEILTSSYYQSFFKDMNVGVSTARAGNVIGGGDWSTDRIIPDLIRASEGAETLIIRNPASIRPWQHVLDPLNGYLTLAERLYENPIDFAGPWNFGPHNNDAKPVKDVVDLANNYLQKKVRTKVASTATTLHEASLLKLSINKAQTMLNWHPTWALETAIKETIDWYNAVNEGEQPDDVCGRQISRFQQSRQSDVR